MAQKIARPRNTWLMGIVAFTLGAHTLLLWLGRFKTSLWYFAAELLAAVLIFLSIIYGLLPLPRLAHFTPDMTALLARLPISIVGFLQARTLNTAQTSRPWYSRWFVALPAYTVIGIVLAVMTRTFLFQPFSMPSGSGIPNLMVGDYFFISKIAYLSADPERGDIVTFKKPPKGQIDYVKRIIGIPGDRVQMKAGRLYLNGTLVERTPVELPAQFSAGQVRLHFYRETLPGGQSYVIAEINDRGMLDETAEFAVPTGHYFMMGDNRDNSADSRLQDDMGFVPRQNIIGRFALRFWNSAGTPLTGRP